MHIAISSLRGFQISKSWTQIIKSSLGHCVEGQSSTNVNLYAMNELANPKIKYKDFKIDQNI